MMADHAHSYPTRSGCPFITFNETAMLARIGNQLRDLYGDVSEAALPSDLLRLASRINEARPGGASSYPDRSTSVIREADTAA